MRRPSRLLRTLGLLLLLLLQLLFLLLLLLLLLYTLTRLLRALRLLAPPLLLLRGTLRAGAVVRRRRLGLRKRIGLAR